MLPQVVEELDVQQHQDMANFLYPVLGFVGRQEAFLGGANHLAVQGFEQKAYILGTGFGLDRAGRVVHRYAIAQGNQALELADACLDFTVVLVQARRR